MLESTNPERDPLTSSIIGAAIEVHRNLGPGLLESIYEACLAWELKERGVGVEQQVPVPVICKGHQFRNAYRVDLVVEGSVIVEVRAVDRLHPLTDAQVLTYLRLSGLKTALVLNFNVGLLRDGVRRLVF
jgi:GxxExxY protein